MLRYALLVCILCIAALSAVVRSPSQAAAAQESRAATPDVETAGTELLPLPDMSKFGAVADLVRDKCLACHSRGYDLAFYASFPGTRQLIERDYREGLRSLDLGQELSGDGLALPVDEATLAKIEWTMLKGTMPPARFVAVQWDKGISREQRRAVLDRLRAVRTASYATGTASKDRSNEPVQPLPDTLPHDAAKAALGEKLFFDKRLSLDDSISCASCHMLDKGGADGRRFSEGVGGLLGNANSPTVFNAAFNIRQFWDGRAADLQEQAAGPPFNPVEMACENWESIIEKLVKDKPLFDAFLSVYPVSGDGAHDKGGWTGENITDALAHYEMTLITPGDRFDLWLKGDDAALSEEEVSGYRRFKDYRCASCHVGKTLGGRSFEYMDLKRNYFAERGDSLPSDEGLKAFTGKVEDLHKFKVPNLRNIELTAPYLHDGTVETLDEAVRIMGVYLSGIGIPPADRPLIVAFLRTLTGKYQGKAVEGDVVPK
ncbi:MAG: cytochrome-c peroxidase [Desulfovibrio sp.]|jgi:cytochrome c peroxidase|nr:cytochrome-c peroxidase [Desulfovibrio sp.]